MIILENTLNGEIPYDLVSTLVILRDWVDVDNAYLNNEHKSLVDIADFLYNSGLDADSLQPEYKSIYNKYGEEFFDKVIEDASAIDSQINHNNVNDLIADYEDKANEILGCYKDDFNKRTLFFQILI